MDNQKNELLICVSNCDIYIKALGHITANICFPLREMIIRKISHLEASFNIYFDLSETRYMDSTFLGLLVTFEKRVAEKFKTHIYILNPNTISMKLIKNMSLDRILKFKQKEIPKDIKFEEFDEETVIDEIEKCKTVLNAHQNLSNLSEENRKKFKSLQTVLEEQIQTYNGTPKNN